MGKYWRNWRREDESIQSNIHARTPWHKHLRLNIDLKFLYKPHKDRVPFRMSLLPIGPKRVSLKPQISTVKILSNFDKSGIQDPSHTYDTVYSWEDSQTEMARLFMQEYSYEITFTRY